MNILFDFVHPADVNVFSYVINRLLKEGHSVTCTVLKRGRLFAIVSKEFPKTTIISLGKHRTSVCGKIIGMKLRELAFLKLYLMNKFDVVVGFGFYAGMLSWVRGSKSIHLHDDKEYKMMFFLSKFFCNKFISFVRIKGKKVIFIKGFKELAYLSPDYLELDDKVLKKLKVKKNKYVYVREIANISVNYAGSSRIDYSETFAWLREKGFSILFDAESSCPYKDVVEVKGVFSLPEHNSIKKNAALIITSGDTVLREGALLGVPTLYTSDRVMEINKPLLKNKLFAVAKNSDKLLVLCISMIGKHKIQQLDEFVHSCDDSNKVLYEEIVK